MPGLLLTQSSTVMCTHGGRATPAAPVPRVTAAGAFVIAQTTPYMIAGCALPPPPTANGPCVTGMWTTGTTRVFAQGQPLAIMGAASTCTPTATPMLATVTQPRVRAT